MTDQFESFDTEKPPEQEAYVPPPKLLDSLENFDAPSILLDHYNRTIKLLYNIEFDKEVSVTQKTQAASSCLSTIQAITRLQTDVYNAERLKKLEEMLVSCIKQLPEPHKTEFLNAYEAGFSTVFKD